MELENNEKLAQELENGIFSWFSRQNINNPNLIINELEKFNKTKGQPYKDGFTWISRFEKAKIAFNNEEKRCFWKRKKEKMTKNIALILEI